MTATTFDTLKYTECLEYAKAFAEAHRDTLGEAELATKTDINLLRTEVNGEMKLIRWMLGILLGGVLTLILKAFF